MLKSLIQNKIHKKHRKKTATNFPKEIAEIANPHEPVLNKIMTTQE